MEAASTTAWPSTTARRRGWRRVERERRGREGRGERETWKKKKEVVVGRGGWWRREEGGAMAMAMDGG